MRNSILRVSLLSAVCLGAFAASANAAGFYLQEQSVSGLGTAFAGVQADVTDSSTVFYNPAGLTELTSPEIYAGATLLAPHASFSNDGSTYTSPAGLGAVTRPLAGSDGGNPFDPEVLPQLYAALPVSDRIVLGMGINSHFGLADDWG